MRKLVLFVAVLLAVFSTTAFAQQRFEISYDKAAHAGPLTGRVILMISRTQTPEPRTQVAPNAIPIFGVDAEGLAPGQPVVIDQTTFGHPTESLSQLPAGEYFVQALLNVYTECKRSDGRTVWVHWDMNGRAFNVSAGNLYSDVQKVTLDPAAGYKVSLVLNKVLPPPREPTETKWIKRIRIKSELLSKFWGIPVYLRATVILPKGYDENPNVRYPVVYAQGQLGSAPYYFKRGPGKREKPAGPAGVSKCPARV